MAHLGTKVQLFWDVKDVKDVKEVKGRWFWAKK
jgi:hypothetical protein